MLALVFGCQGLIAVLLLAMLVPPFENSDEFNHMNRADQIASGGVVATRYAGRQTSGGIVDTGINRIDAIISTIRFHPERKVSGEMMRDANIIPWGQRAPATFANTAIYAPFLYVPAVAGIWAGKVLHVSIARTLIIARTASGLASVALAASAIAAAGEAAPFLFVMLSLPMSLSLMASVSQDGLLLALAAGAVALTSQIMKPVHTRLEIFVLLCLCLTLVGLARPAYVFFCVLPLLISQVPLRQRIIGVASSVLAIGLWSFLVAALTMINAVADRGVAPKAQLRGLIADPGRLWVLAKSVVAGAQGMEGSSFYREFVGILGWIDVVLPGWFYDVAGGVLAAAVLVSLPRSRPLLPAWAQGVMFAGGAAAVVCLFLLEYLTWTPVGFPIIQGIQGRYFLPIALFLPCMLPAFRLRILDAFCKPLRVSLLAFPTLSVAVSVSSVVRRYYL
jgi:uncharacterized membrane protein